jgi:hypothetical protein
LLYLRSWKARKDEKVSPPFCVLHVIDIDNFEKGSQKKLATTKVRAVVARTI